MFRSALLINSALHNEGKDWLIDMVNKVPSKISTIEDPIKFEDEVICWSNQLDLGLAHDDAAIMYKYYWHVKHDEDVTAESVVAQYSDLRDCPTDKIMTAIAYADYYITDAVRDCATELCRRNHAFADAFDYGFEVVSEADDDPEFILRESMQLYQAASALPTI